jgi:hypothetical protein
MIGRAGFLRGIAQDERAILHAGHVAGMGTASSCSGGVAIGLMKVPRRPSDRKVLVFLIEPSHQ